MVDNIEETSKYSMSDFYKVLKWIPRSKVDRQEPCDFDEVVVDGESIVLPTIYEEFNGIDEVFVFINFNGVHVDIKDVLLDFSPLVNGNLSLLQVNCKETEIDYDNDTLLVFTLDNNVKFADKTRQITGVNSLKLSFGTDAKGVKIQKILMKCFDYTYTLSDIENFLITGENHVLGKLGRYSTEVPKELKQYIYMAAGAYAWLSRWEYEAKPMKEPKAEADNYATRLLNQVNNAIADYINNLENQFD
ncbi:MAG: hypothetical protein IKF11_02130, partial [Methanobrevibacter sp.]|nr:hypothetical protein [Methanobrevibacter sp.]